MEKLSDQLKARRKAKLDRQKAIMEAAEKREGDQKGLTAEELAEFETLDKEIDALDPQIKAAEAFEKRQAAESAADPNNSARPAAAAAGAADAPVVAAGGARRAVPAVPDLSAKDKTSTRIGILCAGLVGAGFNGIKSTEGILKHIEDSGFQQVADHYRNQENVYQRDRSQKSLTTLVPSQGGVLIPIDRRNEIIDLLYPTSAYFQGNPVTVPMPNGNFTQPAAATGSSAGYRAEGARSIVTEPSFRDLDMKAFILTAIVPITDQLLNYSEGGVRQWTENNLRMALTLKADSTLLRSTGAANTPTGITNNPGAVRTAGTAPAVNPTVAQLEADFRAAEMRFSDLNIPGFGATWLMNPHVVSRLADMRDANGNRLFPELQGDTPTFRRKRVIASNQIPTNLGAGTNETEIALVDWNWVWYGDAVPLRVQFSDQATVFFNSDWQSAFQQGLIYLKAEMEHDTEVAMTGAVQVITGVAWQG